MHVALLGDSTLDNRRYTNGGPAVVDQLEAILGDGHSVTLLAVDGDTTRQVPERLSRVPKEASHLVLSVGGNDALEYIDLLGRPAASVSEAITVVSVAVEQFDRAYRACLREVLALDRPTIVCTIYNGAFPEPAEQRVITATVRLFDDAIMQAASDAGCPVLDLRRVCDDPDDYWDPIEPNATGGGKIARAIGEMLIDDATPGVYPIRRHAV